MQAARPTIRFSACRARPSGFTLTELMVVVAIIGVLAAFAVPSYRRAIEQSRVDIAGANLRAIWAAQRLYWLENQTYTSDLGQLRDLGLLDPKLPITEPTVPIPKGRYWDLYYWYSVTVGPNPTTPPFTQFTAKANASTYTTRTSTIQIDESGELGGNVTYIESGLTRTIEPIDLW